MRRSVLISCVVLAAVLAGPALAARAAAPPSVTLKATPSTVTFGQEVRFSGHVSPPSADQIVDIVDGKGNTVAKTTTTADGSFLARGKPDRNMSVHAQWGAVSSDAVPLRVRPRLSAHRSDVRLFETTTVTGRLLPTHAGARIMVTLWREGNPVERMTPKLTRRGTFAARFEIDGFGTQSFVVRFNDGDHVPVAWRSKQARTSVPPSLHSGSSGPYVQLLERRLAQLHYRVYGQDLSFDYHDADSVMAFHKVQGMARTEVVDEATWRALGNPKDPKVVGPTKGVHWEVDLTKQVLYQVQDGGVSAIIHVSSGKPSTPTRPGDFHVWTKQAGTNDKGMYYSSFFDGNRALHGYPDVPPYAASHGCVRMPFWNAVWVYDRAPIGIEVLVHY